MTAEKRLLIERIETLPVAIPVGSEYQSKSFSITHRSAIFTRVHTDGGIVGEAFAGDEKNIVEIDTIIQEEIVPRLLGEDALVVERCWQLARPATFDFRRDRRLGLVATACVDNAIWDAIGKAHSEPLWRLWGGFRNTLPMISIGGSYSSPLTIAQEVEQVRERGLAGMKLKVGELDAAGDARRVREARAAGGEGFILIPDANQGWTREEAIAFARLIEDCNPSWFEEPCRWDNDRAGMRDVRAVTGLRICAGQSEHSAAGCRDLIADAAIDVCNFDSAWSGGPTEWRRAAALALVSDVKMAHHAEPQIASHLLASIPHGMYAECFDPTRDPLWWNAVTNRPKLTDGAITLSTAPGFGWELDMEYLDHHRV